MNSQNYTDLHLHTIYSLRDGYIFIDSLIEELKKQGKTACAITDHGNMIGVLEFYHKMTSAGLKPLLGCEVYVAPHGQSMYEKLSKKRKSRKKVAEDEMNAVVESSQELDENSENFNQYNHLILIAKDLTGYKNLCKIVSLGYTDGFYQKPRIDFDTLKQYHDGLVCSSACLGGIIPQTLLAGKINSSVKSESYKKAKDIATDYKNIFNDDYYIEIQNHGMEDEDYVNPLLEKLAQDLNIKIIATNDAHFLRPENAIGHDVVVTTGYNQQLDNPDRAWQKYYGTKQNYVKSKDEMLALFPNHPEYIYNTQEIVDKCNVELKQTFGGMHLPIIPFNEQKYNTQEEYFRQLVLDGMHYRYGLNIPKEHLDRMSIELDTIIQMGFINYFLVVRDYCVWAKDSGIPIGPSRGSAGGSIVAYALRITEIDPMPFNLLFDRFLNKERVTLPDVDTDMGNKDDVYKYAQDKYGINNVCHVLALSENKARTALADVARALNFSKQDSDAITKLVPDGDGSIKIKDILETVNDFKMLYEHDKSIHNLIDLAMLLEGTPRNIGVHASAIVIADKPVFEYAPLLKTPKTDVLCVQFQGTEIEELGLIKMDFLGLTNITAIKQTCDMVKKNRNIDVDFSTLNIFKYPEVYETLFKDTTGVFQFESNGMSNLLKNCLFDIEKVKQCKTEEDKEKLGKEFFDRIVAAIALYRPGPMDFIPTYLENMRHPEKIVYRCPQQKEVLENTYGVMVYQEQIMQIFQKMAGFSFGKADIIRRGIAKKHLDMVLAAKDEFIIGCENNNISKDIAEATWADIEASANYSFNKSHALGYSLIAFETAFLKHFYEPEYMACVLSNAEGDNLKAYIGTCNSTLKLKIDHPDINLSDAGFTAIKVDNTGNSKKDFKILFGLSGIEKAGAKFVPEVIKERKINGNFKDLMDFLTRLRNQLSSDVLVNMIRSGCFDAFDSNRRKLELCAPLLLTNIKKKISQDEKMAARIAEELEKAKTEGREPKEIKNRFKPLSFEMDDTIEDFQKSLRAFNEKSCCNMFFSENPLLEYSTLAKNINALTIAQMKSDSNIINGNFAVILSNIKVKTSKKNGRKFCDCTVSDLTGEIPAKIFEKTLLAYERLIVDNKCLLVSASIKRDNNSLTFIINAIYEMDNPTALKKRLLYQTRAYTGAKNYSKQQFEKKELPYKEGLYLKIKSEKEVEDVFNLLSQYPGKTPAFVYASASDRFFIDPQIAVNISNAEFLRVLFDKIGDENVFIQKLQ